MSSLPASLEQHPLFPELLPYLSVEHVRRDGGRFRLELHGPPQGLARKALRATCRCADCGRRTHPIRQRRKPGNRRSKTVGHGFYVAACCPLGVNVGCSRGKAARGAYQRLRYLIEKAHAAAARGGSR